MGMLLKNVSYMKYLSMLFRNKENKFLIKNLFQRGEKSWEDGLIFLSIEERGILYYWESSSE